MVMMMPMAVTVMVVVAVTMMVVVAMLAVRVPMAVIVAHFALDPRSVALHKCRSCGQFAMGDLPLSRPIGGGKRPFRYKLPLM
jgi:hypothetical protein